MKCMNCSNEIADGSQYCTVCGAGQSAATQINAPQYYAPALQLPTGRSLVKMIFLSLITFGIYGIVIQSRISSEINITASR